MKSIARPFIHAVLAFAFAATAPGTIAAQTVPGGNIGRVRAEATVYRNSVRTLLLILLEDLGSRWDNRNELEPTAFYAPNATIVLGPNDVIEGRDAIRSAFAGRLKGMHGVLMTMDEFDTSGELAFVRGTIKYDLIHAGASSTKETATFAMLLRNRRDVWVIQSHTIAGIPIVAGGTTSEPKQIP